MDKDNDGKSDHLHIQGIAINPHVPTDGKPFIITKNWTAIASQMDVDRKLIHPQDTSLLEQLDRARDLARRDWFDKYPYGIRYEIHCLDGRVPDRATVWGTEGTLAAAIQRAIKGPAWDETDEAINEEDLDDEWNGATRVEREAVHWHSVLADSASLSAEDRWAFERWYSQSDAHQEVFRELDELFDHPYFTLALEIHNGTAQAPAIELAAAYWFRIMTDAEVSDEDWKKFKEWLAADAAHQAVYAEFMALWDDPYFQLVLKEKESALEKVDMDAVFSRKAPAVVAEARRADKPMVKLATWTAIAASLVFAAFIWVTDVSGVGGAQHVVYQTSAGERRTVRLSDGTEVEINTDTQLYVEYNRERRKVVLSRGDAHFDVVKDGRPFFVEGGTGLVRVMGTAFEVRVSTGRMDVVVERGRVAVSPQDDEAQYLEVTPRQQVAVTYYRLGDVKYLGAESIVADWRDGWLEFRNEPLGEVIVELDKYYIGNIRLDDSNLSRIGVSGTYNINDIRRSIKMLAQSKRLNYTTTRAGDIIFSARQ